MVITRRINKPNGINGENIFLMMIDAHEERDTMTSDTPNAFTQASLKRERGKTNRESER